MKQVITFNGDTNEAANFIEAQLNNGFSILDIESFVKNGTAQAVVFMTKETT